MRKSQVLYDQWQTTLLTRWGQEKVEENDEGGWKYLRQKGSERITNKRDERVVHEGRKKRNVR